MPVLLDRLPAGETASRNVGQIHVTSSSGVLPFKHGVDSLTELCIIRLVDAASVYSEVAEVVLSSLVCAEM